jgi:RimJ/RimL family protein N-acetyltransferase
VNLKYRFAKENDLEELVNINIRDENKYRKIDTKMFLELIPEKRVIIALENQKIVGLIYFMKQFLDRTDIFYIQQITIPKKYRRKGIALKLLKSYLKHMKKIGAKKVMADIHDDNVPSILMCLKAGAVIGGYFSGLSTNNKDKILLMRFDL